MSLKMHKETTRNKGSERLEIESIDALQLSVFGQATFPLFDKVYFTAGLRYEYISKTLKSHYRKPRFDTEATLDESGYDTDADWNALLPKATLSWNAGKKVMGYASVGRRGYMAGGLNAYENDKDRTKFDEQTSMDYEVGTKTQWFDNRLSFNLDLFYMDIKDIHVYSKHARALSLCGFKCRTSP